MNVHAGLRPTTPAELAHQIELGDVSKTFAAVRALDSVSLAARAGELLAITGPSGAGKTTLCRIIAGLETPDAGVCRIAGRDVASVPAAARRVAYMFESYALYPHLTVRENVMSPLIAPNGRGTDIGGVDVLLDFLEIRHLSARLPAELSGGQKQRVALARTLVQRPAVTLLDEPISHLDAKLRHKLRSEIRRIVTSRPSPTLWCTPDAMEALSVADRVAVIDAGRIEQIATPEELWRRPATVRVARLVGDPPMNLLPGRVESHAARELDIRVRRTSHSVDRHARRRGDHARPRRPGRARRPAESGGAGARRHTRLHRGRALFRRAIWKVRDRHRAAWRRPDQGEERPCPRPPGSARQSGWSCRRRASSCSTPPAGRPSLSTASPLMITVPGS